MTLERRLRALEEKAGVNKEPIIIIVERIVSNNPKVLRGEIDPSEERGDGIYEHTVRVDRK